jgi:hypothetical protein
LAAFLTAGFFFLTMASSRWALTLRPLDAKYYCQIVISL